MALAISHDVQVVHLLRPDEAEVHLTWPVTLRLSVALAGCGQVRFRAGDDWGRIRLQTDCDVSVLMSLVSVAIQANTRAAQLDPRRRTPCPAMRVVQRTVKLGTIRPDTACREDG
jgi:hypothetical protein